MSSPARPLILLAAALLLGCEDGRAASPPRTPQPATPMTQPTDALWRNDPAAAARAWPTLAVGEAVVRSHVSRDNSGGLVPGPSQITHEGFVRLAPEAVTTLQDLAAWEPTDATPPAGPDGFDVPADGWHASPDLRYQMAELSPYNGDTVRLAPAAGVLYYMLTQD